MRIQVNGEARELPGDELSVRELLVSLGIGDQLCAVERNAEIVPRATHATALVRDGDVLEIVHFVGGG